MARKTGLGRGLDALIPGSERPTAGGILEIPVENIERNPRQPRSVFDAAELEELSASIRRHGVLQPLIVTPHEQEPGRYILIAGERRLMAARQAGLAQVPALVRQAADQDRLELALIENLQRSDLSPLESAEAYRQLAEDFNLSHDEIAVRVGKSRTAVTNTLRLLKLAPALQQALASGAISEGHARALLALNNETAQEAALQTVLTQDLTVRQTEELVRRLSGQRGPANPRPPAPPEIRALEERLRSALGTRVRLTRGRKGGTVVIHYFSDEELNRLIEQMLGEH